MAPVITIEGEFTARFIRFNKCAFKFNCGGVLFTLLIFIGQYNEMKQFNCMPGYWNRTPESRLNQHEPNIKLYLYSKLRIIARHRGFNYLIEFN